MVKKKEDVCWNFCGQNLNKHKAKVIGFTILVACTSAIVTVFVPLGQSRVIHYGIIFLLALAAYLAGKKIFR